MRWGSYGVSNVSIDTGSHRFETAYNSYVADLERGDQADSVSFGGSREHELNYMNSHYHRFERIFEMIPKSEDSLELLDIGTTPFTMLLNEVFDQYNVSTLDYTDVLKPRCEEAGIDFRAHDLSDGAIPFDRQFNVIIFTEVLEHVLAPPTTVFDELYNRLDSDGKLIFGTPNFARLKNRILASQGQTPLGQFHPDDVHGHGHVREYTLNECMRFLSDSGFDVVHTEYTNGKSPIHFVERKGDNFDLSTGLNRLLITGYLLLTLSVPSFRHFIYIIARK
jgi:2-polyprenyl-3-methyl-5-hydroxy-6-metoxy-1,4-benzoquinol methylase